jgi:hypothetical protein
MAETNRSASEGKTRWSRLGDRLSDRRRLFWSTRRRRLESAIEAFRPRFEYRVQQMFARKRAERFVG